MDDAHHPAMNSQTILGIGAETHDTFFVVPEFSA
jgi:hypothetical protein